MLFQKNNPLIQDDMFYEELEDDEKKREKMYRDLIISEKVADSLSGIKIAIGAKEFVYNTNRKNKYHTEHINTAYR